MESLLIPIIVAAAVALVVWTLIGLTSNPERKEKRKLAERLSTEQKSEATSALQLSITRQMEATGLPMSMASNPFMQKLHRKVIQAWPEGRLQKFLMFVIGGAIGCGLISAMIFANLWVIIVGTLFGGYVPFFVLNSKRSRRQRNMVLQLPEALDFLSHNVGNVGGRQAQLSHPDRIQDQTHGIVLRAKNQRVSHARQSFEVVQDPENRIIGQVDRIVRQIG